MLKYIWSTYVSMAPYLLFGFTIAGFIHLLIKKERIVQHLGRHNSSSVFKAALLGVPLPLCSCSVIPTAVSLRKEGASNGAVMAFLISTPLTGVDSILATYGIMGWFMALFRAVIAFLLGILGGLLSLIVHPEISIEEKEEESCGDSCSCGHVEEAKASEVKKTLKEHLVNVFDYAFDELLGDILWSLLLGILLSGLIGWLVPDDFLGNLAIPKILQMGLMILVGIPLYICATSSLPLAAALMMKGLSPGVVFLFLAAGPATNAATMTTIINRFGKRFFFLYLTVIILGSIGAGFLLDALITRLDIIIPLSSEFAAEEHHGWFSLFSAGLLGLLMMRLILKKLSRKNN